MPPPSRNERLWEPSEHDRSGDNDQDDTGPYRLAAVALIVVVIAVGISVVILWLQ
jgi:hypothetical protein